MRTVWLHAPAFALLLSGPVTCPVSAQHEQHAGAPSAMDHRMWTLPVGGGWYVVSMAQAFPALTLRSAAGDGVGRETGWYITQPAIMANLTSPNSVFVLRATLNFEAWTQKNGELTWGGWGEGFIDKRHPHTLLHELTLSLNAWNVLGGSAALTLGKAFAPFGTDDPMSRPGIKYPTNHHLSQILERWLVSGVYLRGDWSIEASVFGGNEPDGPYDLSNIESFGNSWSARLARRWGAGQGPFAQWETSVSFSDIGQEHDGSTARTRLWNAAIRHEAGGRYALLEASRSDPDHGDGDFSVLGEVRLVRNRHQPYARAEYATRPEFERAGARGTDDFYRYDHDADAIGGTRWFIGSVGYGFEATDFPVSIRPFAELQYHRVRAERGGIRPETLFGQSSFRALTLGARLFFGGDPMRMGTYGVLDAMTEMHRASTSVATMNHSSHED